jgi:hypothetical protein
VVLIKWALLLGSYGSIQPSMQAHIAPSDLFFVDQKLSLSANNADSFRIGELDESIGFKILNDATIRLGHKSELSSEFKLKSIGFVELSYSREFK